MADQSPDETQQKIDQTNSYTVSTFFASLVVAFVVFGVQVLLFVVIKGKLPRIYRPRTYLVPERERTSVPPTGIWQWAKPVFRTSNSDFIQKCGLDAYFFLRYLRLLLKLFIPMAMVILPILLPINAVHGRGSHFSQEEPYNKRQNAFADVRGLNQLGWGNVRPTKNHRYWAHCILAVGVVIYTCWIFFDELRGYIRLRQAYLTSPQHRLRASATTVLVSAIPKKWCTAEALDGLYDVFPGGIRNIWINRNFDELSDKIAERDKLAKHLESAETDLIKKAKKADMEQKKKEAKRLGEKRSKAERAEEQKRQDADAAQMARKKGQSSGNPHQVSHTVDDLLEGRSSASSSRSSSPDQRKHRPFVPIPILGEGIDKVGHEVANLGRTVFGGIRGVKKGIDDELHEQQAQGFQHPQQTHPNRQSLNSNQFDGSPVVNAPRESTDRLFDPNSPSVDRDTSPNVDRAANPSKEVAHAHDNTPQTKLSEKRPVDASQVEAGDTKEKKSRFAFLKFWEKDPLPPIEYPAALDEDYDADEDGEPLWKKYVKEGDRDTMRLPIFGQKWLGWVPFVGKKVDTINHCRKELARLNVEIEEDQKDPSRYPLMNSAFIQFNHQVAAHMACQAVSHHMPNQMAPRVVEISPDDVIWDNMSIKWWEVYLRTGVITALVVGLIIGWAFPVAFTGALSNISGLADEYHWLAWLHKIPQWFISPIQGVLPQLILAILLAVLPIIMRLLAKYQGHSTGMAVELAVQNFYYFFLFVQVFLVITIASSATNLIPQLTDIGTNPQQIPQVLAEKLPSASNYFFSYLLLQALSTSAGVLLQVAALAGWFLLGPIFDSTARQKWSRQIKLPDVKWGTFFPVYTNLATIGLIYSVISPLILVFNIVTFSLFWFVYRYNTLYVTKFRFDTGGLLFPTAINQLFTGLYVMELCLIGLFFLVRDVDLETADSIGVPCTPQAIIMIIVLIITVLYQWLLNRAFSPLFRYLPITLEDDAVIRDEEFARAQEKRWNIAEEEQEGDDINEVLQDRERRELQEDETPETFEMKDIERKKSHRLHPRRVADKFGDNLAAITPGKWADKSQRKSTWERDQASHAVDVNTTPSQDVNRARRRRTHQQHKLHLPGDEEAEAGNNPIGDALFAGIHDEIEDLTAEERDKLVQRAFQHSALRSRRPVIWIPRDDLGVSNDEIARTKKLSSHIWISNEYTGLDSKARVVYSKSPPDFSEVDLIEL